MKSYLINLDRSPERLAFFTAEAGQAGVVFERVSARDGRTMEAEELARLVGRRSVFQPINAAEAALFLTHRLCWQKLLDSDAPFAAIFEDDAVLAPRAGEILSRIAALVRDIDVIKLETTGRRVVLEEGTIDVSPPFRLQRLASWHGGTAAYAVSRRGAEKLLSQTMPVADPVDQVMFNPLSPVSASLDILQLLPAIAIQHDILEPAGKARFTSTIGRHDGGRRLFRHGLVADLKRALKKHSERRRRKALARMKGYRQESVPFAGRPS